MLLNDLDALARRLPDDVCNGRLLDAYLVAAGMAQIAEDHVHRELRILDAAADVLTAHRRRAPQLAGGALAGTASAARAVRAGTPGCRAVIAWQRGLAALLDGLAATQVGGPAPSSEMLCLRAAAVGDGAARLPAGLRAAVLRLPACFHAFDQRPADVVRLAGRVGVPVRTPLLVAGVRTSGSYLAPLCAARLRADGYREVAALTVRPGRRLLGHERARVRSVVARGGRVLLLDDPPVTGGSLARAAEDLQRAGVPAGRILLVLAVFGAARLPEALSDYDAVLLPEEEWAVAADLRPAAVARDLAGMLALDDASITVEPRPLAPSRPARGHVRARFAVRPRGGPERDVVVEGIGLGYLGAQEYAAARSLERFAPAVLGVRDGLLYREWLPESRRLHPALIADEEAVAGAIAAYVAERRRALPVPPALGARAEGLEPAWEVASAALSRVYGRGSLPARVLLTDRLARRLLEVPRPAVVDGNTDLAQWFHRDDGRGLVKVNLGEDRFGNLGASCFDPAFDLAGATARAAAPSFAGRLRRAYEELEGEEVDAERWLLYELVHLRGRERTEPESAPALRRARARTVQRYLAEVYLADVAPPHTGPLCVLDVDGVLETEHLGFPSMTPASALALRALLRHGHRAVLATGRSVGEVAERCRAYRLAGGVAEYGAAIHLSEITWTRDLLDPAAAGALHRLRGVARETDGLRLDESHHRSARVSVAAPAGPRGLRPDEARRLLARAGVDGIGVIRGDAQTDFVAEGIDKATGVRALLAELGGGPTVTLAVGDTAADVPLAALADRAYAPSHARAALGTSGFEVMAHPYQAGLAEAVGRLIGHRPGACPTCRPAPPGAHRRLLLDLLATQERGVRAMPLQAAKLVARMA